MGGWRVRRAAALTAAGALCCLWVAGCAGAGAGPAPTVSNAATQPPSTARSTTATPYPLGLSRIAPSARRILPGLSGRTVAGQNLSVRALRGHVVVVNVWASWCEPCRSESPLLEAAARGERVAGVRFVGLDENDTPAAATTFLRQVGSSYPHLDDPDGSLLALLSPWVPATAVPSTLVVDAEGRVAARFIGAVTQPQLGQVLATVAAGG